jgi:hypothetical protein
MATRLQGKPGAKRAVERRRQRNSGVERPPCVGAPSCAGRRADSCGAPYSSVSAADVAGVNTSGVRRTARARSRDTKTTAGLIDFFVTGRYHLGLPSFGFG